ncbi:MAG: ImmA/IrrE family metallo-endopeptidase [Prevotellaceae bacterium]|jgi:Zn-dependent peptidase ImmA (M78 family)|nr:ImmA/IrrE family metallo-endopeptidase [Prevotellaceae bacterium]
MTKESERRLIEQQVVNFRQEAELGYTDALNIKSLLLKLKVVSVFRPLSDEFCGMSLKDSSARRFMLINSNQPIGRQHFTIAHELYHLFVEENSKPHRCTSGNSSKNPVERQADLFASMLLIPAEGILRLLPKNEVQRGDVSLASVLMMEHYYAVSRQALLNRLGDLGFINKHSKEQLSKIPARQSARDYGYDTALYFSGNENLIIGDFGEKARTLFDAGKISEGHYLELLNKLNYHAHEQ